MPPEPERPQQKLTRLLNYYEAREDARENWENWEKELKDNSALLPLEVKNAMRADIAAEQQRYYKDIPQEVTAKYPEIVFGAGGVGAGTPEKHSIKVAIHNLSIELGYQPPMYEPAQVNMSPEWKQTGEQRAEPPLTSLEKEKTLAWARQMYDFVRNGRQLEESELGKQLSEHAKEYLGQQLQQAGDQLFEFVNKHHEFRQELYEMKPKEPLTAQELAMMARTIKREAYIAQYNKEPIKQTREHMLDKEPTRSKTLQ